ncbi:MAG: hypothetical protein LBV14_07505, partial [Acidovorax sp.]|nr:hypothetical protein [Acidovorax sp.]
NPRKAGIIAVGLDEGDVLIGAALTDSQHDVMLFSDGGKAVRFDENDVRPMGRTARGVRGMNIEDGQSVIAMLVADQHPAEVEARKAKDALEALQTRHKEAQDTGVPAADIDALQQQIDAARTALELTEQAATAALAEQPRESLHSVLTATENGYGKRTSIVEYTRHGRGTKGMIAIQQSERNGKVVAATLVAPEDEIMLITDTGVLVRTRVAEIREMGRATQGVTLIALDAGAKLSGLQRIAENDANGEVDDEAAEGGAEAGDTDGGTPQTPAAE